MLRAAGVRRVGGAQDVTKHLHVTYLAPTQDFVNPGDAPDYPQQWYRPLVLGHGRIQKRLDPSLSPQERVEFLNALSRG